jgi:hypothetical protein
LEKILSLVLGILFVILAMYFVCWFLFMRRPCREQFRTSEALQDIKRKQAEADRKAKNNELLAIFSRLYVYFFVGVGQWKLPTNHKTEKEEQYFSAGEIVIDSFTERARWFAAVEFGVQISLAIATFIPQLVPSPYGSCIAQGVLYLLVLVGYLGILFWKKPFKLRFTFFHTLAQTIQQIIVVISTIAFVSSRREEAEDSIPDWLTSILSLSIASTSVGSLLACVGMVYPALSLLRKLRSRLKNNSNNNNKDLPQTSSKNLKKLQHRNNDNDFEEEMLSSRKTLRDQNHRHHHQHLRSESSRQQHHHRDRDPRNNNNNRKRSSISSETDSSSVHRRTGSYSSSSTARDGRSSRSRGNIRHDPLI